MAIEAIATPVARSEQIRNLVEQFNKLLGEELERAEVEETKEELRSLQREITFRKDNSIRNQVRNVVATSLSGDSDGEELAKEFVKIYDDRSTLIHTGYIDPGKLSETTSRAREIVQRVLTANFLQTLGQTGAA